MESLYMKNLLRTTGKSYKDIYSEKDSIGDFAGGKDLINKYEAMEKKVLYNYRYLGANNDSEALTIVYHGLKRDFGGRAHLQFDEIRPVIHLISYETDVADFNIKTHVLYMGENYSPTTESHMDDFQCLFSFKDTKVQKGTGTLKHDDIIGDYWTGLSVDTLITQTTTELNFVDSLSQNKVFDDLFMAIYQQGTNKYHVYKYQLKQMTQMVLSELRLYETYGYGSSILVDMLVDGGLTDKAVLSALNKMLVAKSSKKVIYSDVDVNQHYDETVNGFVVRNFDKSMKVLNAITASVLRKYGALDVVNTKKAEKEF